MLIVLTTTTAAAMPYNVSNRLIFQSSQPHLFYGWRVISFFVFLLLSLFSHFLANSSFRSFVALDFLKRN